MIFVDASDELSELASTVAESTETIRETINQRTKAPSGSPSSPHKHTEFVERRTTANTVSEPASKTNARSTPLINFSGFSPISTPGTPEFEVGESLGAGGMGSVYTAVQTSMERSVAVKRSHDAAGQGATYQSVAKEGMLFGRLDHPNIPPVHMVGRDREGHACLVMKLIEGTDLRSMISDPKHPRWDDVDGSPAMWLLDVFIQVTLAVEHAHSNNILHRDIKTENIMVGDFGQVFLIDWGIAIDMNEPGAAITTGKFVGTPCFAAPEMATEGVQLDQRTDVYLLGAMLLEMISGGVLFKGRSLKEILHRVRTGEREEIPATVPNALTQIIYKATDPNPNDRYESVREFRAAVHGYRSDRHHYQNIARAENQLDILEGFLHENRTDVITGYRFMTLAHESLALLKAAVRANVAIDLSRKLLARNVTIQTKYSIVNDQLGVANALVAELERELGSSAPLVLELKSKIDQRASEIAQRESELQVQANLKMIEKMHHLEKQIAELQTKRANSDGSENGD